MSDPTNNAQGPQQSENPQSQPAATEPQPVNTSDSAGNLAAPDKNVKVPKFQSCMASDPTITEEIVRAITPQKANE